MRSKLFLTLNFCAIFFLACSQDIEFQNEFNNRGDGANVLVGPRGGIVEFWSGEELVKVEIPPGALSESISVTIKEHKDQIPEVVGKIYDIGPSGTIFNEPVTISIARQDNTQWPLKPRYRLAVKSEDDPWELIPMKEGKEGEIVAQTTHFSLFGAVMDPSSVGSLINQSGRSFSIGSVGIKSSLDIQLHVLTVSAETMHYVIGGQNEIESSTLTLFGLRPNATVYIFDGSLRNRMQLITDSEGRVTYEQNLGDHPHSIWLQNTSGTVIISSLDPSGCEAVGRWQSSTKTCFLGTDLIQENILFEQIEIATPDTTLDCQMVDEQFNYVEPAKVTEINTESIVGPTIVVKENSHNFKIVNCSIVGRNHILAQNLHGGVIENNSFRGINLPTAIPISLPPISTEPPPPPDFSLLMTLDGVRIFFSEDIEISYNSMEKSFTGFLLYSSNNADISNNTINSGNALVLTYSNYTNIFSNHINSIFQGIGLHGSNFSQITENMIFVDEKWIYDNGALAIAQDGSAGIVLDYVTGENNIINNIIHGPSRTVGIQAIGSGISINGPSSDLDNNGAFEINIFVGNEISYFNLGIFYRTSGRADHFIRNVISNNSVGALQYGSFSESEMVLDSFGEPIQQNFVFYYNDIINNGKPQINSIFPLLPLYDKNTNRGNHWGRRCLLFFPRLFGPSFTQGPFFDLAYDGRDSRAVGVEDPYPYGVRVAKFTDMEQAPSHQTSPLVIDNPERGCQDTDGDNFLDFEEFRGMEVYNPLETGIYAGNHDYLGYLDLPGLGAKYDIPDIFVEVDYMDNRKLWPNPINIQKVVDAFARQRINLHVDLGDLIEKLIEEDPALYGEYLHFNLGGGGDAIPEYDIIDQPIVQAREGGASSGLTMIRSNDLFENYMERNRWTSFFYVVYGRTFTTTHYLVSVGATNKGSSQVFYKLTALPEELHELANLGIAEIDGDRFTYTSLQNDGTSYWFDGIPTDINNPDAINLDHGDGVRISGPSYHGPVTFGIAAYPFVLMGFSFGDFYENLWRQREALNFMHELGHALGLQHGGFQEANRKPNYPSVMNYSWEGFFDCPDPDTRPPYELNYSHGTASQLNEKLLIEQDGITGLPHIITGYVLENEINGEKSYANECMNNGPINWNRMENTDTCIRCDINNDQLINVGSNEEYPLVDHNDWANLQYRKRYVTGFAAGPLHLVDETGRIEASLAKPFSRISLFVKPGSGEVPPFNIRSRGLTPIAFISEGFFNAFDAVTSTATFGSTGREVTADHCTLEDVNIDGIEDLLCHFPIQGSGLTPESQVARAFVETTEGFLFGSSFQIRLVP